MTWFRIHIRIFITTLILAYFSGFVNAHPVSHTDAWIKVSDVLHVRLNVFLHDVVELPTDGAAIVSREAVADHIRRYSDSLAGRLQLYANGEHLIAKVTDTPDWLPSSATIDLDSESSLRLSWQMEFNGLPDELQALSVVHGFTGEENETPGELRIQLRTREGRRMAATVPPARPYTLILPTGSSATDDDKVNRATSRMIQSTNSVVHEFTAPLTRLVACQPLIRDGHLTEETPQFRTHIGAAEIRTAVSEWFEKHVALSSAGASVGSPECSVLLFPNGVIDGTGDAAEEDDSPTEVAVMGTVVGVRQTIRRPVGSTSALLRFNRLPGDFSELAVNVVSADGESLSIIAFAANRSADDSALQFETDFSVSSSPSEVQDFSLKHNQSALVSESHVIDHYRMATGTAICLCVLALLFFVSSPVAKILVSLAVVVVAVGTYQLSSFVRYQTNEVEVTRTFGELLGVAVSASSLQQQDELLNRLSSVLEDELLESTFLEFTHALADDSSEGALVSLDDVVVDNVSELSAPSEDEVLFECSWNLQGSVYHWGHMHGRIHACRAQIHLSRSSDTWKLGRLDLLDVSTRAVLPES